MPFKSVLKKIVRGFDQRSPIPILYPFVMSNGEKRIFDAAIKRSKNYLEFGVGGSTLRAIQKSNAHIYAVESSSEWLSQVRKYQIFKNAEKHRLHVYSVDIGPTQKWGHPLPDNNREWFPAYSTKIFNEIDKDSLDLVLVDGRFRVACALQVILQCHANPSLQILFHDFWDREHYHVVLKYLDVVEKFDTLGLFTVKRDIDMVEVENDFEAFKYDPK